MSEVVEGELIHVAVRRAIEVAVEEELTATLGAGPYERGGGRCGYRNGTKPRAVNASRIIRGSRPLPG